MNKTNQGAEKQQFTLFDHLSELRERLIKSAWAIAAATGACFYFSGQIFDFLRGPATPYLTGGGLVFTGPADKFIAHIKISFFVGVILSCPFWFYQIWKFVAPGLYTKEKKYSAGFILCGSVLFLTGISFAYFWALPAAFKYLFGFGGTIDKPMITIDQYMSFFLWSTLMFGVSFELPLIIVLLGMLGIVNQKILREKRRYAVVAISTVAALITPPDLLSMIMMLVPMLFLYEISIMLVGFFEKKKAEQELVQNNRE